MFIASTFFGTCYANDTPTLKAMAWLKAEHQLEILSSQPHICIKTESRDIQLGHLAFMTPQLLGGQAAKAGLSCDSCHQNGQKNIHFFMPNVSDKPGTADVSHSFFSSYRGNKIFDPVDIPDLSSTGKISHTSKTNELEVFISKLIIEEFNGLKPTKPILSALADYVRELKRSSCQNKQRQPVNSAQFIRNSQNAVSLASQFWATGDKETARFLIVAARHQLGIIFERYHAPQLSASRKFLLDLDQQLLTVQKAMDKHNNNKKSASTLTKKWLDSLDNHKWQTLIIEKQHISLFNPNQLKKLIDQ